ncbi:hypothetical protein M8C21_001886 [Ambrosia artemisiifolia]|uniref:Uncharacterized protein n=1 Tax=Ambrosia artemisiifolia TaxID=4212 RepID=A0AAD5D9X1_AMBAR|nr:hypothetical protein M8C21_001886 [Ambrosia artemisiifolia]
MVFLVVDMLIDGGDVEQNHPDPSEHHFMIRDVDLRWLVLSDLGRRNKQGRLFSFFIHQPILLRWGLMKGEKTMR